MSGDTYPKYQLPSGNWTTDKDRADRIWARHEARERKAREDAEFTAAVAAGEAGTTVSGKDQQRGAGAMSLPEDTHLAYIVFHEAWYASAPGNAEQCPEVSVGAYYPDDGCAWEFQVEEHDFGQIHGKAIRLGVFDDAFAAFTQVPGFFEALATEQPATLPEVCAILDAFGAVDETPRVSPYPERRH